MTPTLVASPALRNLVALCTGLSFPGLLLLEDRLVPSSWVEMLPPLGFVDSEVSQLTLMFIFAAVPTVLAAVLLLGKVTQFRLGLALMVMLSSALGAVFQLDMLTRLPGALLTVPVFLLPGCIGLATCLTLFLQRPRHGV